MDKQLTIIVPGYNEGARIGRCLDSLVSQTYKELEIVVIDDGSNDDMAKVVDSYVRRYSNIRYVYKENGGISSARNLGLDNVNTPYFGFVDSDDYVEPEMFATMLKKIKEEESDVCVCNFIWEYPDKSRICKEGPYTSGSEMIVHLMATLWNKIYRTDVIRKLGLRFPLGYRYEDSYFLLCLAANDIRVSFVDRCFVHYVQHSSSIVHTNNEKVHDMIDVFDLIRKYYEDCELGEKYKQELEFLYAKYFLGSSFLRACQIKNKETRDAILGEHVSVLYESYPDFKKNPYLSTFSWPKRLYYRLISNKNYKIVGLLLHCLKHSL